MNDLDNLTTQWPQEVTLIVWLNGMLRVKDPGYVSPSDRLLPDRFCRGHLRLRLPSSYYNNASKLPIRRRASIFAGRRMAEHSASPPKPFHQQLALGDGERFGKAHHRLFEARAQNRIRASDLL